MTKIVSLFVFMFTFLLLPLSGQDYNSGAGSGSAAVLKHPVAVIAVPAGGNAMQIPAFIEKLEIWKNMKTEEGVALPVEEWATTIDLLKQKIADSNAIRVMELPASAENSKTRIAMPDYLLMAKFGTTPDGGKRVFLRLADPCSGAVVSSSSAFGAKFEDAIDKAMRTIENDAAMCAWRCRISEVSGNAMIINRGRIDGVRAGDTFQGWKITSDSKIDITVPDELLLMKYGQKTGKYKVIEEGKLFSKVEAVGDAPLLAAGDVLEQPDIWLKDKKRESRAKRVWDKIYDKNSK